VCYRSTRANECEIRCTRVLSYYVLYEQVCYRSTRANECEIRCTR